MVKKSPGDLTGAPAAAKLAAPAVMAAAPAAAEGALSLGGGSRLPVGELDGPTMLAHGTRPSRVISLTARCAVTGEDEAGENFVLLTAASSLTGGTATPRLFSAAVIVGGGEGVGSASLRREKE